MRVAPVHEGDLAPYRWAVEQSRSRLARWNPVDPDDLTRSLTLRSPTRRTFLIHALAQQGDHDIVGKVNISDVVRGRFQSAAMGYDAYDPYAGRGLFAEGLRLILDLLFTLEEAGGLGLHRVQAGVQPGNVRSAGLLRSLGFQREGFSPRMLWLPGADGSNSWRDHDSYVMLRDEWPAQPYAPARGRRIVALVTGVPASGDAVGGRGEGVRTLASQIAVELRIPLFVRAVSGSDQAVWALLADSPVGGVVESCDGPADACAVAHGLQRCGLDPALVPEVWCGSAPGGASHGPLGLGPTVVVDTRSSIGRADVVRIALQVAAGGAAPAFET